MTNLLRRRLCASLTALALPTLAIANPAALRFATLAPRGSLYHRALLQLGEAWRKAEGGSAAFTVFTDGVQGGEVDVVRRMRIGQINGAMITAGGLRAIEPGAAALQFMPLTFHSWEELDAASARLRPELEQRMAARGFIVLYWGEAGWVRFFSKTAAVRPADFLRLKIACGTEAPEQADLMNAMGYHPVTLETTDVMPGLQTGLIDAVPTVATLAHATQINTAAPHMLDMRWAPIVGAAVVTRKAWESISPAGQTAVREAALQATAQLRAARESSDREAIDAMIRRGLTVHTLTAEARREWDDMVTKIRPAIRGKLVPTDMFDTVQQALVQFRSKAGS